MNTYYEIRNEKLGQYAGVFGTQDAAQDYINDSETAGWEIIEMTAREALDLNYELPETDDANWPGLKEGQL